MSRPFLFVLFGHPPVTEVVDFILFPHLTRYQTSSSSLPFAQIVARIFPSLISWFGSFCFFMHLHGFFRFRLDLSPKRSPAFLAIPFPERLRKQSLEQPSRCWFCCLA